MLLIGIIHIYLGVHYATDVLAGFLVSTIYLIFYTGIVKRYFEAPPRISTSRFSSNQRLILSFKHAVDGIIDGLKNERNMMIHYSAVL